MKFDLNQSLSKNEKVLAVKRCHWIVYGDGIAIMLCTLGVIGISEFLAMIAALIGSYFIAKGYMKQLKVELILTNRKIIVRQGLKKPKIFEFRLRDITKISVDSGLLGEALGYGDIKIHAVGNYALSLQNISDPAGFRGMAVNAMSTLQNS